MERYKIETNEYEKPLVSIIMGAYNCEKTLSECIDSIIEQTYDNWELVVCNDCSTDGTERILEKYQLVDKRIIVLKNDKNLRLAASLNKCLENAKGKYVARMDADDISMPERLEKQVLFLEKNQDIDLVGTNMKVFDDEGERGIRISTEYPTKEILIKRSPFAHPTIMMKKEVYVFLGGYTVSEETMRAEDLDLWFRFFENGFKGYNLQEALYSYRESMQDFSKRTLKAAIMTSKVYWKGYKRIGVPLIKRIWVIKPILAAIIPNKFMYRYHSKKLR